MIAHLSGTVLAHGANSLILDVSGVGYRVYTSVSVISEHPLGERVSLHTHLVVRETALELFGFSHESEVRFFELLIGVSGIGPRSALAIMNLAPVDTLAGAIGRGDTSYLTKVSGIGTKNAQKIVVELKDKLDAAPIDEAGGTMDADVIDALTSIGYSLPEARRALAAVPADITNTSARLKEAIRQLGSQT